MRVDYNMGIDYRYRLNAGYEELQFISLPP